MYLVPESHRAGIADFAPFDDAPSAENEWFNGYQKKTSYMSHLTSKLKYTISEELLGDWIKSKGIFFR